MLSSLLSSVRFAVKTLWFSLCQLVWGMFDQTHYHFAAFKLHAGISVNIVNLYLKSFPKHFIAHVAHQWYLRELGFDGESDLIDIGTTVWEKNNSKHVFTPVSIDSDGKPIVRITGMAGNKSGNPAHVSLASLSLQKLWHFLNTYGGFSMSDATFIDFGCGTGLALLSAMTQPFQHVIGIELDKHSSDVATDNVIKFKNSPEGAKLSKCDNVSIACSDMQDFDFKTVSTPALTTIFSTNPSPTFVAQHSLSIVLYLYEPLWTLSQSQAHAIYTKVLTNARESKQDILVAYFDCGLFSGNALASLTSIGAALIHKSKAYSLEFGTDGHMWIYRL